MCFVSDVPGDEDDFIPKYRSLVNDDIGHHAKDENRVVAG